MPFGAKTAGGRPGQGARRPPGGGRPRSTARRSPTRSTRAPTRPLYSFVPDGLTGAIEPLKDAVRRRQRRPERGQGQAGPGRRRRDRPRCTLNLQYNDRPLRPVLRRRVRADQGPAGEVRPVQGQPAVHRVGHSTPRTASPTSTRPTSSAGSRTTRDADNYLTPFFLSEDSFLKNHYNNPAVNDLIPSRQLTTGQGASAEARSSRSRTPWPRTCPTLPLPPGRAGGRVRQGRQGCRNTLDASFKFRYGELFPSKAAPARGPDQPERGGAPARRPASCWSVPHLQFTAAGTMAGGSTI